AYVGRESARHFTERVVVARLALAVERRAADGEVRVAGRRGQDHFWTGFEGLRCFGLRDRAGHVAIDADLPALAGRSFTRADRSDRVFVGPIGSRGRVVLEAVPFEAAAVRPVFFYGYIRRHGAYQRTMAVADDNA